ncbi:MAG: hypothetical protein U0K35_02145 [Prevotella sp.]|nr:hypothetical protein [Prevotella sp.]
MDNAILPERHYAHLCLCPLPGKNECVLMPDSGCNQNTESGVKTTNSTPP